MHINPYLFILAHPPHQIIWNYEHHTQHELDLSYSTRLAQLISDPTLFDNLNPIDVDFLNAEILTTEPRKPIDWKWDPLSKIFHIGTKNIPCEAVPQDVHEWAAIYLEHCNEVLSSPAPSAKTKPDLDKLIFLAPCSWPDLLDVSLTQTLIGRRTSRSFSEESISLKQVSTLLYLTLGYLSERHFVQGAAQPEALGARRSSPSGGGLNACEGYLYVRNVGGLQSGVYSYYPDEHALGLIGPLPTEPLGLLLGGQHFINTLPFGLFLTSRFDKLWWKYEHSRTYRMAFIEAGHVSQVFLMVATGLGLDTWLTGALTDCKVEQLLGLKESPEQPLFFVGCGQGDGQVHCEVLRILADDQDMVS
ncbi:SagB/ThcOx family dehydrogenase [Pseudomonas sp. Z4-7]|uniref:SagB/ThcOx family dehydrogenase n=1 Tax=Pseudomonas sp. Z4-7 TaxID=2817413 RepID=UPI003DA7DAD7